MLVIAPMIRDEANDAIDRWHRHHKPVRSCRFALGAFEGEKLRGALIVGNPNAPELAKVRTVMEILRSATPGDQPDLHAASMMLGAARRAARAMGCRRLISYTRADESGTSYLGAGFHRAALVDGREWNTGNKALRYLPGLYVPTTEIVDRVRWEAGPDCACDSCSKVRAQVAAARTA